MGVITYEHQFETDRARELAHMKTYGTDMSKVDRFPQLDVVVDAVCASYRANPVWFPGSALVELVNFRIEPGDGTRYDVAIGRNTHRHSGSGQYLVSLTEGGNRSYWFQADTDLPHWTYIADKLGIKSTTAAYAVTAYVRCVLAAATGITFLTPDDARRRLRHHGHRGRVEDSVTLCDQAGCDRPATTISRANGKEWVSCDVHTPTRRAVQSEPLNPKDGTP